MIKTGMYFSFYQFGKRLHIHYITGPYIRFPYYFYFQFIIMPMIIRQSTFTKYIVVGGFIPTRII